MPTPGRASHLADLRDLTSPKWDDSTSQITKGMDSMKTATLSAAASGTFKLGNDLPIHRLGFGAMRLTGKGIWGEPENPEEALRLFLRAAKLAITFTHTATSSA